MKLSSAYLICFLAGFAWTTSSTAAKVETREDSYKTIAAKNVFRLNSPPKVEPSKQPLSPPPQITLQGLTTISGRAYALFKIAVTDKARAAAKETAFVLGENEREGEIEVLEINAPAGTVKFSIRGTVQVLSLKQ